MSIDEIITDKLNRLTSVPDALVTATERAQIEVYSKLLELLSSLEKSGDVIKKSKKNLSVIEEILTQLRLDLDSKDSIYFNAVKDFTDEIGKQQLLTDSYFVKVFGEKTVSAFAKEVAVVSKKQAVKLLFGSSTNTAFFNPIREQITNAVISGSSYKETVKALREVVIGNAKKDGVLQSHVKQIAHDTFAVSDRAYTQVISEEVGAEWYRYRGSEIKTSRPFCKERHQQYFHKKEIEAWGDGEKTIGLETPDKTGHWTGEALGTTAKTIFTWAGGYNCRHSIVPVSISVVPREVISRAIAQGFYKP